MQQSGTMNLDMSTKLVRLHMFGGEHNIFKFGGCDLRHMKQYMDFSASFRKTRYPGLPSGKDTVIYLDNVGGNKQERAKNINTIAIEISNIIMVFTSELLIGMIYQEITTEWPSGMVHMVSDLLFKKYVPQDMVSKIELRGVINYVGINKE